jgi:hypothetical protein
LAESVGIPVVHEAVPHPDLELVRRSTRITPCPDADVVDGARDTEVHADPRVVLLLHH